MNDPEVLIPIKCPECGEEWLEGFPVGLVAGALLSGGRIHIKGRCHSTEWDATAVEMGQMRQYLGAGCIGLRDTSAKYAVDASVTISAAPTPGGPTGSLRRPERPTYTRLARDAAALRSRARAGNLNKFRSRQAARDGLTPAAKILSSLRRLWVFEAVFVRRGR